MFSIIGSLFGTMSSKFILALVAILTLVILFNSDTILSKFNFETKSNIIKQLAVAKNTIAASNKIIINLNNEIDTLKKKNDNNLKNITAFCEDSKKIDSITNVSKSKIYHGKTSDNGIKGNNNSKLNNTEEGTLTVEQNSLNNIAVINKTYTELFV